MHATRRSLLQTFPLLALSSAMAADTHALTSVFEPYKDLPVTKMGLSDSRAILDGTTHTGERLEVHETTLAAGDSPHPPHRHTHEELFLVMKGSVAVTIEGTTKVLSPGSAAFVDSNAYHGVINPAQEPAQYFVIAIGV